jgi:hypothetical protein
MEQNDWTFLQCEYIMYLVQNWYSYNQWAISKLGGSGSQTTSEGIVRRIQLQGKISVPGSMSTPATGHQEAQQSGRDADHWLLVYQPSDLLLRFL